jgi:hypothetical protein
MKKNKGRKSHDTVPFTFPFMCGTHRVIPATPADICQLCICFRLGVNKMQVDALLLLRIRGLMIIGIDSTFCPQ